MIQKLRVPEHCALGDHEIRITAEIDEEGEARTLELTPLAREELEAIAAVAGHRDLRTTSRYFDTRERAATAALRARTAADQQLEIPTITATITGAETGTESQPGSVTSILPLRKAHGRVAQLDRALPSGANQRGRISCKKQRTVSFDGSQKDAGNGTAMHDNWNGSGLDHRLMIRRAWGALRCV